MSDMDPTGINQGKNNIPFSAFFRQERMRRLTMIEK